MIADAAARAGMVGAAARLRAAPLSLEAGRAAARPGRGFSSAWPPARCGLRVRVEGTPLRSDVLFAANHVSWLDIIAIGGGDRRAFVAKRRRRSWPVVGWLAEPQRHHLRRPPRPGQRSRPGRPAASRARGGPRGRVLSGRNDRRRRRVLPSARACSPRSSRRSPGSRSSRWRSITGRRRRDRLGRRGERVGQCQAHPVAARDDPGHAPLPRADRSGEAGDRKVLAAAARAEIVAALGASAARPDRL